MDLDIHHFGEVLGRTKSCITGVLGVIKGSDILVRLGYSLNIISTSAREHRFLEKKTDISKILIDPVPSLRRCD